MKLSTLIFISIFFILVLFSITTYVNFKQYQIVNDNAEFLSLSSNTVRQSNQLQRNILNMERNLKNYAVTGDPKLMLLFDSTTIQVNALFDELSATIPTNSTQFTRLQQIKTYYQHWFANNVQPFLLHSKEQKFKPSANDLQKILTAEETFNNNLQPSFRELLNVEYSNRTLRKAALDQSEQRTKNISFLLTVLSVAVGFIIAILLARHISKRINRMVYLANQIAAGNYNVQVNENYNDELTTLSRSLNHMSATLQQTISQLKRRNGELNQFAHIVSHDLKTPLRGIDNVISWIEEDHTHEIPLKVQEYLQLIKGRISRSENLIEGILSYARIGKNRQERKPINTDLLVNEIVSSMPSREGLSIEVSAGLPILNSEEIPLTQILTNLISNSIKYHDKPNGWIKIYSEYSVNHFLFYVQDNGPGIDKKYHDKIFQIFQTLQENDSFESTGVGLAIVRKILDERNETIYIDSEPGKGTTFSFTWSQF